ncbi:hypothetical protein DPSP01_013379 [Paraphaeosphaeria sporulosa]
MKDNPTTMSQVAKYTFHVGGILFHAVAALVWIVLIRKLGKLPRSQRWSLLLNIFIYIFVIGCGAGVMKTETQRLAFLSECITEFIVLNTLARGPPIPDFKGVDDKQGDPEEGRQSRHFSESSGRSPGSKSLIEPSFEDDASISGGGTSIERAGCQDIAVD